MIGSEYDLVFFSRHAKKIKKKLIVKCVSNLKTINTFNDIFNSNIPKNNKLPFLKTYNSKTLKDAIKNSKKLKYPFILKGRLETSSRNVFFLIKNYFDLKKKISN